MEKYLLFLAINAIPTLIWALLFHFALKSEREWAERNDAKPRIKMEAAVWLTVFVIGQGIFWILVISLVEFVGKSKVSSARSNAKSVYDIAAVYHEEFPDVPLHTVNTSTDAPAAKGSLEERMQDWLPGHYYYAVVMSESGEPQYAYWSLRPIEESEMQPFDQETQLHIYMSPFIPDEEIVGSFDFRQYQKKTASSGTGREGGESVWNSQQPSS